MRRVKNAGRPPPFVCARIAALIVACLAGFPAPGSASAAESPVLLWPGRAPGDTGDLPEEKDTTKDTDNLIAGRRLIRLGNVSQPSIQIFRPPADKDTGAAVLVCPGGAYQILALDLEGSEVCEWLNSIGVTGVLLKYRVPKRPGIEKHAAALQDAQRAMGLLRSHASKWRLNSDRLGVLGFSAGGHLAAAVSTATNLTYARVDDADASGWRPGFTVLIYPGYLTVKDEGDRVAPELVTGTNTPPTFLCMTQDDGVRVENVLHYALALRKANVPLELHVYPKGGHGYGLRRTENPVTWWPDRVSDWMRFNGWLKKP